MINKFEMYQNRKNNDFHVIIKFTLNIKFKYLHYLITVC